MYCICLYMTNLQYGQNEGTNSECSWSLWDISSRFCQSKNESLYVGDRSFHAIFCARALSKITVVALGLDTPMHILLKCHSSRYLAFFSSYTHVSSNCLLAFFSARLCVITVCRMTNHSRGQRRAGAYSDRDEVIMYIPSE